METNYLTKKQLRKKMVLILKEIPQIQKDNWSQLITNKVLKNRFVNLNQTIGVYYSISNEVNTKKLIMKLLSKGKKICLPRIENNQLEMHQIDDYNNFDYDLDYGIKQPNKTLPICFKKDIDVMIIPGLGFDKKNFRLGRGKGYYDKYLVNFSGKIIMLAFSNQEVDNLCHDNWDVKVHKVIKN